MKKKILITVCVLLAVLVLAGAGLGGFVLYVKGLPVVYNHTFSAGLCDKYDRLAQTDGERIIVIGGSSVAFGIDSQQMEELTGLPCVNFGMYATLGTAVMLDLAQSELHKGDIVVLAPELERKTLSASWDALPLLQALDGRWDIVRSLPVSDWGNVFSSLNAFADGKKSLGGEALTPEGLYARSSLNEYGDVTYSRTYNIMAMSYDPTTLITPSLTLCTEEYLQKVNAFVQYAQKKGAKVYYSFPPVNALALTEDVTEETLVQFTSDLASRLACPIISDIREYIMDEGYFYDTNFHTNETGTKLHTAILARDILRADRGEILTLQAEEYAIPARPDYYVEGAKCDKTGYFVFTLEDNAYILTGLTDTGKKQRTLNVPYGYEGLRVTTIAENAFAGGAVEEITFPADTNIALCKDGAFGGADKLAKVTMLCSPDQVLVGENLLKGAGSTLKFYIPRIKYANYAAHYFWSPYYKSMIVFD